MPYIYLFIAITTEVIGSAFLKSTEGFTKIYPTIGTIIAFGICFYALGKSLEFLPLNIAYATWAGLGLVLTTLVSIMIFKENINFISVLSIALIVIGVVLLNTYGSTN